MTSEADLTEATKEALRAWRRRNLEDSPFSTLRLYQQTLQSDVAMNPYRATTAILTSALNVLAQRDAEGATLLRERYDLRIPMAEIANEQARGESTLYHLQHTAIASLARIIADLELEATSVPRRLLSLRLPPPSAIHLVGVEEHVSRLAALLRHRDTPWLIALVGIGGLGKTSLADQVARQVILQGVFEDVVWVSAQQVVFSLTGEIRPSGMPALTKEHLVATLSEQIMGVSNIRQALSVDEALNALAEHLSSKRFLIVIDNLETMPDVERLLPWLRRLHTPSKILLTSRMQVLGNGDVFPYMVPELGRTDAFTLLRQEAHLQNFPDLSSSSLDVLDAIYKVVGGNPLALRLIVGQAYIFGVATVLQDIAQARHKGEQLYAFIYQYVWTHLAEMAKTLLLGMLLVPQSGGTLNTLLRVTGIPYTEALQAVEQLVAQNLLNVRGDVHNRQYTIHNLTRAFLKEDVAKW